MPKEKEAGTDVIWYTRLCGGTCVFYQSWTDIARQGSVADQDQSIQCLLGFRIQVNISLVNQIIHLYAKF